MFAKTSRARLAATKFLIERDGGIPVRDLSLSGEKRVWSDLVEQPLGNWEANHSNWSCHIMIR